MSPSIRKISGSGLFLDIDSMVSWLTLPSIKKFFDVKELILLILPTTGFYYQVIPEIFACSSTVQIVSTILLGILIYTFCQYKNYSGYEKSIAELLETGYFTNFLDKVASSIKDKRDKNEEIVINFKDNSSVRVRAGSMKVKVILPTSENELIQIIKEIDKIAKPGSIENGPWVLATVNANNTITIYECPRTLKALSQYLVNGEASYTESLSKKLHKYFNEKFDKDWDHAGDKIPLNIFSKSNKFEV